MEVYVDPDLCCRSGLCVSNCPEVFQLDEENPVTVMMDSVPAELGAACQAAAFSCPAEAISIEE